MDPKDNLMNHHISISKWEWIKIFVFGIILVPVRILMLISLVILTFPWFFVMRFVPEGRELTWIELKLLIACNRTISWMCGLRHHVEGEMCDTSITRILVIAPHTSVYDTLANSVTNYAASVSKREYTQIPIFGWCMIYTGCIMIDKTSENGRIEAVDAIGKWLKKHDEIKPEEDNLKRRLTVCPEGRVANGKALQRFKTGIFRHKRPVQPTTIKYDSNTITWTFNQNFGGISLFLINLAKPWTDVYIKFLPPYLPSEEEKADPKLYAHNVSQLMAREVGTTVSKYTGEEMLNDLRSTRKKVK